MLDTYIIEELKRRERERVQRERSRPMVEVPKRDDRPRESNEVDEQRSDPDAPSGGTVVQISF